MQLFIKIVLFQQKLVHFISLAYWLFLKINDVGKLIKFLKINDVSKLINQGVYIYSCINQGRNQTAFKSLSVSLFEWTRMIVWLFH
jgi:hypothetical protein